MNNCRIWVQTRYMIVIPDGPSISELRTGRSAGPRVDHWCPGPVVRAALGCFDRLNENTILPAEPGRRVTDISGTGQTRRSTVSTTA